MCRILYVCWIDVCVYYVADDIVVACCAKSLHVLVCEQVESRCGRVSFVLVRHSVQVKFRCIIDPRMFLWWLPM